MEEMIITDEMKEAMYLVNDTSENLFITGKAGTGKTMFLKHMLKNTKKNCVVAAPTGIAAINAGGVTLHSLFLLPFGPISPTDKINFKFNKAKRKILQKMDVLVIDEISMVRPDVLDAVDRILRFVRRSKDVFGGVQVIMFGDLFQLPPVVKANEKAILDFYYDGEYFFNALCFKEKGFHVIEFSKIFRQTDQRFIHILNNIRNYNASSDDLDILGELKSKKDFNDYDNGYIHICSHKRDVESINERMLGNDENLIHTYCAKVKDKFPNSSAPCDIELRLRVGARVMALANSSEKGYYNGMLGYVTRLDDNSVVAKMDNGNEIVFSPHKWENCQYEMDGDTVKKEVVGTCEQIPLALAWAITIHKSQGLTFDKIAIHITYAFCPGQLYVALSRCRSLEGIISDAYITKRMIIPDQSLLDFEKQYKSEPNHYWQPA